MTQARAGSLSRCRRDVEKLWAQAYASMPISSIIPTLKIIKCNYQLNHTSVSGSFNFSSKIFCQNLSNRDLKQLTESASTTLLGIDISTAAPFSLPVHWNAGRSARRFAPLIKLETRRRHLSGGLYLTGGGGCGVQPPYAKICYPPAAIKKSQGGSTLTPPPCQIQPCWQVTPFGLQFNQRPKTSGTSTSVSMYG